jgi:hypothetical protein
VSRREELVTGSMIVALRELRYLIALSSKVELERLTSGRPRLEQEMKASPKVRYDSLKG